MTGNLGPGCGKTVEKETSVAHYSCDVKNNIAWIKPRHYNLPHLDGAESAG